MGMSGKTLLCPYLPNSALQMFGFEGEADGDGTDMEGEIDIEGKGEQGYTDVSVREAVEWTMSKDTEFTYIDVRSAEEHEKLATVRYRRTSTRGLCPPTMKPTSHLLNL